MVKDIVCDGRAPRIVIGITLLALLLLAGLSDASVASSTKFINDNSTGGDCTYIGIWNSVTSTCTLTSDLTETIQIDSDGITLDGGGHSINGSNTGNGIYLQRRSSVTIKNLDVRGFSYGIYLYSSSNNSLVDNTVSNNDEEGIFLRYSDNNTLSGNTANSNGFQGIEIDDSGNNRLNNNTANSNGFQGIEIDDSGNNILNNNTANSNGYQGIELDESSYSTLNNNTANSNVYEGIYLCDSSDNTLSGNNAFYNSYGIYIHSYYRFPSNNNVLYHNNFINNSINNSRSEERRVGKECR